MRPLPFRLRDITPHGLYPRTLLIAILPVVLLLIAVTYVFYDSHWRQTSRKLSQGMASDIAYIVAEYETQPETLGAIRQRASDLMRLEIELRYDAALPTEQKRTFFTPLDDILTQELSVRIDKPFWFDISGFEGAVIIEVALGEDVMRFIAQRDRTFSTTGHIFIVWVIGATILLILLAVGFLRNQIRSILRLTEAAKAFGRGQDAPDYRPSGATEIREAARAVLDMKARLTSFAEQRTAMLAGVSHDLRTPLTRLKLQFAMLEDSEDVRAARADLDDMEMMLDEYLAFASGEEGESAQPLQLDMLLKSMAHIKNGDASLPDGLPGITVSARPMAVKRAISNLINNALAYGQDVRVSLKDGPHYAEIIVDDDGPGIEAARREEAFRPFTRLEDARTQNQPGTGLGLALARDTARAHGGDVRLEDSPLGGLRARLRLPH